MSGFTPIFVPFFLSIGVLLQLGVYSSTSDQIPIDPLLCSASLTFLLATTLLPFLLLKNIISLRPISVRFTNYLTFATKIASVTTLMLLFPNFKETPHQGIVWAICSGLICIVVAVLYRLVDKALLPSYRHCFHVAFLTLCVAFAGLHREPLLLLPATKPYISIIPVMNFLYHFALVPVAFLLGTILVITSICIAPPADMPPLPFVSVTFKEGLSALTLAVGLTTLIIGASLWIYTALVNFPAGGFEATLEEREM